jgi:hypothetical protein
MNSAIHYPHEVALIESVARYLYGTSHPDDEASVNEIQAALLMYDPALIDRALDRLAGSEIVLHNRRRDTIMLTGHGKELYSLRCIPEVVLGLAFCRWRYERAVVRLIVPGTEGGESAGTGFFVNDPAGYVVTNRHVVAQQAVIRINDLCGNQICDNNAPVTFGPDDLDLALVRCTTPPNVLPLRIDWSKNAASPLDDVLVLGYPYVALHEPTLFSATGQVTMYAAQLSRSARESLILTRIAAPGCSGGPVISSRGLVIGIVVGEPSVQTSSGVDTMLCAVPAHYVGELSVETASR